MDVTTIRSQAQELKAPVESQGLLLCRGNLLEFSLQSLS